jgi:murein L,D-transpeptidase YcbB/YkuD
MAFIAAAVVGGVGSLVGGVMGSNAARDAANTQADAARYAADMQKKIYDQQRADQEPWRQAGQQALTGMQNADFQKDFTMADFQADPGYQFRMDEGQKALERSAAAKGGMMSGGTLKAISKYGQGVASQEYQSAYDRFNADRDRRFNRLGALAGVGQTATNQMGAAGQNYANQAGAQITGAANAGAAGQIGQANAIGGALQGVGNTWMNYSMMNRMFPAKDPVVPPKAGG